MSTRTAAVIGCGRKVPGKQGCAIGHAHGDGYRNCGRPIELFAVDPDEANLKNFAEKFEVPEDHCFASTQQLYEAITPEMVSIATWPHLHHTQVIEAATAGTKAIICEKPLALDGTEIDEMLQQCEHQGAKLVVAHQRAYLPIFEKLRALLHEGAIGDGWVAECRVGERWDMLSWSIHWMDLVGWLFDAQPTHVLGGVDHQGNRRYRHAVEDNSVVFVEYPESRQAIFITGPDIPTDCQVEVRGRDGAIRVEGDALSLWNRQGYQHLELPPADKGWFASMIADLFDAVDHDRRTRLDASRSAMATKMAWLAHESARTMKRIELPSTLGYAPLEVVQHPPKDKRDYGHAVLLANVHHPDPTTGLSPRTAMVDALQTIGASQVTLIEAEQRSLTTADLEGVDLLVVYHTQQQDDASLREAIGTFVQAGKPVVISHCGIGSYPQWTQWRQWMCRHWVWKHEDPLPPSTHPHEPCVMRVLDRQRFDPGWDEAWLPRDEIYLGLHDVAPMHELAHAERPDGSCVPIAWQSADQPNVVTWVPGHRRDIWHLRVVRDGLRAAIDTALRR